MNLQDQGMRFYVNEDGESRWMHPEIAEHQNKGGSGWHDLTDASEDDLNAALGPHNPPMPQSNQERQEALRARRAMLGMTEVRGVYLPPSLHAELKAYAKKLAKQHKPEKK